MGLVLISCIVLLLDCRWPYSLQKLNPGPVSGKKKRYQGFTEECCKHWMYLGIFPVVY